MPGLREEIGCEMTTRRNMMMTLLTAFALLCAFVAPVQAYDRDAGFVEHEVQSAFSHIRIRRNGYVRTMIFVRDNGEEAWESQMNLKSPHVLKFTYLQHMFANYLLQPKQSKVLIVGLGGGSMVHFLQKHDPTVAVDAVEIDPVVVQLAERFFNLKPQKNVKLIVADGFEYFKKTQTKYDTIYMDAFLKPSAETDETGVPLQLRTIQFYQQLQSRLTEGGCVVFNINPHAGLDEDLKTITKAFPQTYVFSLPNSEGVVAVGSMLPERRELDALREAGDAMDKRFKASFSFEAVASRLRKPIVIKDGE